MERRFTEVDADRSDVHTMILHELPNDDATRRPDHLINRITVSDPFLVRYTRKTQHPYRQEAMQREGEGPPTKPGYRDCAGAAGAANFSVLSTG